MRWQRVTVAASALASIVQSSTLTPPVLPLIVRNPYLSTWLGDAREVPWSRWPMFWTGEELGLSVLASVPDTNTVYPLLGRPHDSLDQSGHGDGYNLSFPVYHGAQYDASVTNLTYSIPAHRNHSSKTDAVEIVLSFLSPVTPTSTLRQSIPASYLQVVVKGNFDINIYIDVNGQWVSGNRDNEIVWELSENDFDDAKSLKTWKIRRRDEEQFVELNDRSEWGTLHFTAPTDVRHESGTSSNVRRSFARTGTLKNEVDSTFRSIMDEEPVFAFSKSFKLRQNTTSAHPKADNVTFTIAHTQDTIVQFASERGLTFMRPLWKSWFSTDDELLTWHYMDFNHAQKLAGNYSGQLAIDAYRSGAEYYVDIVALSARQTLGATSFSGTPSSPLLFLKEIASNGNCQTVDVIFPAFPFFLYTSPRWLAYLLEPLFEHQLSGQYPNKYSMHDLGTHFPNMTGHADGRDEYMPVEECGDMLIMGLALVNSLKYEDDDRAQSLWSTLGSSTFNEISPESPFSLSDVETRDGVFGLDGRWGGGINGMEQAKKWLEKAYPLWKQWTKYLVDYTLEPHNQLTTDDFAGWLALHSNLALKGIIGIKAMSELSSIMDEKHDVKYYKNISEVYIKKWEEFAMSRDNTHAKLAYDWYGSWTTLYSLYADAVLCFHSDSSFSSPAPFSPPLSSLEQQPFLPPDVPSHHPNHSNDTSSTNFIPSHIYAKQSAWYLNVMQKYGLPLDSRHLYTKSDWQFEAAAVASKKTRTEILNRVSKWVDETATDRPLSDLYETEGRGGFPGPYFFARPVVGGHFAFLTLERACSGRAKEGLRFLDEKGVEDADADADELD